MNAMLDAISNPGHHAILFGDRGVGKTSLSNVLSGYISSKAAHFVANRVNCEPNDTFSSLWRKMLRSIEITEFKPGVGFTAKEIETRRSAIEGMPRLIAADDVKRVVDDISRGLILVLIFDEFDRIRNEVVRTQMADTIKMLSDFRVQATVVLIGVADSVDQLIAEHQSVERALIQIPMPRMSAGEVAEILSRGLSKAGMTAVGNVESDIKSFSQGLPYVAHLLSLHSARAALRKKSLVIDSSHVAEALKGALDQWQQSIRSSYYEATKSPQPGHMYREVLLACAVAPIDEFGFFAAADVREPLRAITGNKKLAISSFSKHLRELSAGGRGQILQCVGEARRFRYRFTGPLMRPYITMRSFADGVAGSELLSKLED